MTEIDRDGTAGELADLRDHIDSLALGLEMSARTSAPSKKSEIERGCASALRGLLRIDGESGEETRRRLDAQRSEDHQLRDERDKAYRERAALVAYLSAVYPSAIALDVDPEAPGWAIIYVRTPAGQMSWHLASGDLDLFPHVEQTGAEDPTLPVWDGHTTAAKYERLAELTATVAAGVHDEPVDGGRS